MKFTVNTKAFYNMIKEVNPAISHKTAIPILTGMKITADTKDGLELVGSNADISIKYHAEPDDKNQLGVTENGSIVVPSQFFNKVVKSMPDKTMSLTVGEDFQVSIASGKSHFKINGLDASNYPHLPQVKSEQTITLGSDLLKSVIRNISINASKQESRPILTGIHIVVKDSKLMAVATDSHRLGKVEYTLPKTDADFDLNIPASSLQDLMRLLPSNSDIKIASANNQILFKFNGIDFYSRLLEGNYPDVSQLVPTETTTNLQLKASDLLPIIERGSLVSHASRNNVVELKLTADKGELKLISNSPDVGRNEETAKPKLSGKDLDISFNPDYMKDALKTLGDTLIDIKFLSPLRPFVITPVAKTHYTQLITPVRTF